jgi:peptidoglycan/LPS O-acetylase OafA/YrhL
MPNAELYGGAAGRAALQKGRWEFLDAVRGVAALIVVVQHGMEHWTTWFLQWSASYLSLGTAGVVAFFLVSGFIIPVSIERYGSLKRFWLGRLFRLGPMYYASFLAYLVIAVPGLHTGFVAFDWAHPARFLIGNLTMMQEPARVKWALGNYWTLTYELFFYFACSILFLRGMMKRSELWAWLAVAGFLAGNVLSALVLHHTLSVGRLGLVVLAFYGTLLHRYFAGEASSKSVLILAAVFTAAFGVVFWLHYTVYPVDMGEGYTRSSWGSDLSWLAGVAIFVVFFLLRQRQFPRPLLWLGRISYSVYLVHDLLIPFLPQRMPWWLGTLLLVALTLAISDVTYRLIEHPMTRLQHRLFPRRSMAAV